MSIEQKISSLLKTIVTDILSGNCERVFSESVDSRINCQRLQTELDMYSSDMTLPPDYAYNDFDLYKVNFENKWIAEFFLWAHGEQSDLMLKIIFKLDNSKNLKFTFWDIYVP